jgi:hypothetical protein
VKFVDPVLVLDLNLPSLRVTHPSVCRILKRTAKPDEERTDSSACCAEVGHGEPKQVHVEKACAHRAKRDAEYSDISRVTEDCSNAMH